MIVELRVFGGLEKFIPGAVFGRPMEIEASPGLTVKSLMEKVNIPEDQVFTVLVNGVRAEYNYLLRTGDRVAFFPPVGGG